MAFLDFSRHTDLHPGSHDTAFLVPQGFNAHAFKPQRIHASKKGSLFILG